MKKYFLILTLLVLATSCKEPLQYKYQDQIKVVTCEGADSDLMHEAYYSFLDDLYEHFKKYEVNPEFMNTFYSLAQYIFKGALGELDYLKIASPHTIEVIKELKEVQGLWNLDSENSNLNYHNEFVNCLIERIDNNEIKQTIISLRETNSLSPMILAEIYRINIKDTQIDKDFEMFLAFDTFYQFLMEVDLSKKNDSNE